VNEFVAIAVLVVRDSCRVKCVWHRVWLVFWLVVWLVIWQGGSDGIGKEPNTLAPLLSIVEEGGSPLLLVHVHVGAQIDLVRFH